MPDLTKKLAAADKTNLRMKSRMRSKSSGDHLSAKNKALAVPELNWVEFSFLVVIRVKESF